MSVDSCLGLPFNIASYAAFTMMVAQVVGMDYKEFIWVGGDCHIYPKHVDVVKEQLKRTPGPLPKLILNEDIKDILDFTITDMKIEDYNFQEKLVFHRAV